jgi:hypothetical protein
LSIIRIVPQISRKPVPGQPVSLDDPGAICGAYRLEMGLKILITLEGGHIKNEKGEATQGIIRREGNERTALRITGKSRKQIISEAQWSIGCADVRGRSTVDVMKRTPHLDDDFTPPAIEFRTE